MAEARCEVESDLDCPTPVNMRPEAQDAISDEPAAARLGTHGALQPLEEAASLASSKVVVVPVEMGFRPWRFASATIRQLQKGVRYFMAHLRLVRDLWRLRQHDLIIVREFLTSLLVIVWPLIWPLRRRVYFLINHNLQEAHRQPLERTVIRGLFGAGARFACFETTAGFDELSITPTPDRFLILPHPLRAVVPPRRKSNAEQPVIGVIGVIREEKGVGDVVERLLTLREQGRVPSRFVFGSPAESVPSEWKGSVEFVNTVETEGYAAALDRCDVIVLNYQRDRYYYRPSGVAADAISRRVSVVCPDFPLMSSQVTLPTPVGVPFRDLNDLERAIREALRLRFGSELDSWGVHESARSPAALAALIDQFVEQQLNVGSQSQEASHH
jgi:glycosyltransferase involved in cell wall biosynthesis